MEVERSVMGRFGGEMLLRLSQPSTALSSIASAATACVYKKESATKRVRSTNTSQSVVVTSRRSSSSKNNNDATSTLRERGRPGRLDTATSRLTIETGREGLHSPTPSLFHRRSGTLRRANRAFFFGGRSILQGSDEKTRATSPPPPEEGIPDERRRMTAPSKTPTPFMTRNEYDVQTEAKRGEGAAMHVSPTPPQNVCSFGPRRRNRRNSISTHQKFSVPVPPHYLSSRRWSLPMQPVDLAATAPREREILY